MSDQVSNVVQMRPAASRAPELEARLLGAVLDASSQDRDPAALIGSSGLTQEHLSNPRVRIAWQIAEQLARYKRLVTAATVFSAGVAARLLTEPDAEWLASLQASSTTTPDAFQQMAEDLRRLVSSRALADRLDTIAGEVRSGALKPAAARLRLAETIQALLADTAGDDTGASDLLGLVAEWDANNREERISYVPTRVQVLDDVIGGWPANLTILAGQPGVGKSAVLASIIDAQLSADPEFRAGLFGLEDGTAWLTRRLVAREMRMKLRDVGNRKKTGLEDEELAVVAGRLHSKLERLVTFRFSRVRAGEIVHRGHNWIRKGVRCIYLDHLGEVDHRSTSNKWEKEHEGIAETVRQLRDFAVETHTPVVAIAHTVRPDGRGSEERPPTMQELAGSSFLEKRARLILGLWHKGGPSGSIRATVLKATEGKSGDTVEFARHFEAALVVPDQGATVNVNAEAAEERAEKRKSAVRESVKLALERARVKEEISPKKPKEPEPPPAGQLELTPKENP